MIFLDYLKDKFEGKNLLIKKGEISFIGIVDVVSYCTTYKRYEIIIKDENGNLPLKPLITCWGGVTLSPTFNFEFI